MLVDTVSTRMFLHALCAHKCAQLPCPHLRNCRDSLIEMTRSNQAEEVMRQVREYWHEHVGSESANEVGTGAPVVQAYQHAWRLITSGTARKEAVEQAVRQSDQWKIARKGMINDLFTTIMEREPTEEEVEGLVALPLETSDTAELARRIVDMRDNCIVHTGHPVGFEDAPSDLGYRSKDDKLEGTHASDRVDTEWMESFHSAYDRDPFVHEYVLVRPMQGSLSVLAKRHKEMFYSLRNVHLQFMDEPLDEAAFVKIYVPRIYNEEDVPSRVKAQALRDPKYRQAMEDRLSSLHLITAGRKLEQQETDFVFENHVFQRELPLDTDDLQTIVSSFVEQGESIQSKISNLYRMYLGRDADEDEVDAWIFPFRISQNAEADLRQQLVKSHEFHSVMAELIRESDPGLKSRDVFKLLDRVLECPDLVHVNNRHDIDAVINATSR